MSDKAVLVSGANKGIGLSIVKGLVAADCTVFLGSRDLARGEEAKASLGPAAAALVKVVLLDVTSPGSVGSAVDVVKEHLGGEPLSVIINNAGGAFGGGMGFSTPEAFRGTLELNYTSTIRVTEAFLPLLDSENGRVVNVSSGAAPSFVAKCSPEIQAKLCHWDVTSLAGLEEIRAAADAIVTAGGGDKDATVAKFAEAGLADGAPYHLSKALMTGYTQALQKLYPQLTINCCSPGFIETDLTRPFATMSGKTPQEMGMKAPEDGAKCPLFLTLTATSKGWYWGSDMERSASAGPHAHASCIYYTLPTPGSRRVTSSLSTTTRACLLNPRRWSGRLSPPQAPWTNTDRPGTRRTPGVSRRIRARASAYDES
jgi:NAD(P)-dependent dehydrogenase (short-subunit alcohol dehydrogenase family)